MHKAFSPFEQLGVVTSLLGGRSKFSREQLPDLIEENADSEQQSVSPTKSSRESVNSSPSKLLVPQSANSSDCDTEDGDFVFVKNGSYEVC